MNQFEEEDGDLDSVAESIHIPIREGSRKKPKKSKSLRVLNIDMIHDSAENDGYTINALADAYYVDMSKANLNKSNAAILCYRRDPQNELDFVHSAIDVCKRGGYTYLLIDKICLPQTPSPKEAEAYTDFYKTLSVIVRLEDFDQAYRPWVYKELAVAKTVIDSNVELPTHLFAKKPRVRPRAGTLCDALCINWQYNRIPIIVFWIVAIGTASSIYFLIDVSIVVTGVITFLALVILVPLVIQPIGDKLLSEINQLRGVKLTHKQAQRRSITKLLEDNVISDPWDVMTYMPELLEHHKLVKRAYSRREFQQNWDESPMWRRLILADETVKFIRITERGWRRDNYRNIKAALEISRRFTEQTAIPVHIKMDPKRRTLELATSTATTGVTFVGPKQDVTYNNLDEQGFLHYVAQLREEHDLNF